MTFSSVEFILFFIIVLVITSIIERRLSSRWKEAFLLAASYFFYGYWDWRFCFLLLFVTMASYLTAKASNNKVAFAIGTIVPLVVLGLFKYFNFFLSSVSTIIGHDIGALKIILPVGISFYTFQALSYVIDVHRGTIAAENNFIKLALYISFFPQLVAGPIVRASDFLPQLHQNRRVTLENIKTGVQIFVFGLFKKIVIADHLSVFVDDVYSKPVAFHWATILLAVVSYSIQIYFDFSGYSDMAIGCAKCLGYDFKRNFNLPYISQNAAEFWRRWHISLGSWFRDYLYYPLSLVWLRKRAATNNQRGKKKAGMLSTTFPLLVLWLSTGLWHGANWTFVFWGVLNGLGVFIDQFRPNKKKGLVAQSLSVVITFGYISFTLIFFRAESFLVAWTVIKGILTLQNGIRQPFFWSFIALALLVISTICAVVKADNKDLRKIDGFYPILNLDSTVELTIFFVTVGLIFALAYTGDNPFIYFQF